jgi:predicted 3-demethylubiquinone-9 3-methyltransferase (glyoxalase superfamily)
MQKITPFLWFDDNAEEAVEYYASVFGDVKVRNVSRYSEGSPGPVGKVMVMSFQLFGQDFMALNGGPLYTFSPAISMFVSCETQEEIDRYWGLLSVGGEPSQCGWLKDKFGVTWQIVPRVLGELMADADPARSQRVVQAMLQMVKLDIAALQRAYDGEPVPA